MLSGKTTFYSYFIGERMNTNKKNWWIDAVLFVSFIITFLMDLTGLELHQWIGILAGVIILFHMIFHWKWLFSILENFFGKATWRARIYFLIDFALITGFTTIIFTGVIMSSWLDLTLDNYAAWSMVHNWASIITLQIVLLKVALHWNWIVNIAQTRLFPQKRKVLAPALQMESNINRAASRRQFLKIGAAVSAVAIVEGIQMAKVFKTLASAQANSPVSTTAVNDITSVDESVSADINASFDSQEVSPTGIASTQAEVFPTAAPEVLAENQNAVSSCVVRCPRGCSFPGRCRKYTDSNNNSLCDLGECK
jgi:hypothetical protein